MASDRESEAIIEAKLRELGIYTPESAVLVQKFRQSSQRGVSDADIVGLASHVVKVSSSIATVITPNTKSMMEFFSKSGFNRIDPAISAAFGLVTSILDILTKLQDEKDAKMLTEKWLSDLETIDGLAPESVRILAAVKEIVTKAVDQFEVRQINADLAVLYSFLANEIIPIIQNLERYSITTLTQQHQRLYGHMETLERSSNIYFQKANQGVSSMESGGYHIGTNSIIDYAQAVKLHTVLQFFHLLLANHLEDSALHLYVNRLNRDVGLFQKGISDLVSKYVSGRAKLIGTSHKYDAGTCAYTWNVFDNGSSQDLIYPQVDMGYISKGIERGRCSIKTISSSEVMYWIGLHMGDLTPGPARTLQAKCRDDITQRLQNHGDIWQRIAQNPIDTMTTLRNNISKMQLNKEYMLARRIEQCLASSHSSQFSEKHLGDTKSEIQRGSKLLQFEKVTVRSEIPRSWAAGHDLNGDIASMIGDLLYLVRCHVRGAITPGKYLSKQKLATIAYGNKEIVVGPDNDHIEILTNINDFKWVQATPLNLPAFPVSFGQEANGDVLYAARALFEKDGLQSLVPGKLNPKWQDGRAHFGFDRRELMSDNFEILCFA